MKITKKLFGETPQGERTDVYRLENTSGMRAEILTYGGILRALEVKGRDVVLGFETLADYVNQDKYYGALVGRVANRIGKGQFVLDGVEYKVPINNGPNCNHGGLEGFDRKIWQADESEKRLCLKYVSEAGEEGFPGRLQVHVAYSLIEDNALVIDYRAETDAPTPVNLTSHAYFNLNGKGNILEHLLYIPCDEILENDAFSLPTGEHLKVKDTPFDFRNPRAIGDGIEADDYQISFGKGYDHHYIIRDKTEEKDSPVLFARLAVPDLAMECYTTQPGFQLYTGNWLSGERGKNGAVYGPRSGVALEAQNWPDAVNHPDFPNVVLRPGEIYEERTIYHFL